MTLAEFDRLETGHRVFIYSEWQKRTVWGTARWLDSDHYSLEIKWDDDKTQVVERHHVRIYGMHFDTIKVVT